MKIAIHGRPFSDDSLPFIQEMFDELKNINASIQVYAPFCKILEKRKVTTYHLTTYSKPDELENADFIISVGGDGTLLETVTFVGPKEIPILGVNTGRLGFLATTPRENIKEALSSLAKGEYLIENRSLINLTSSQDIFDGINFGLNEFTILKRDSSSMIVIHTYIDGEYLNAYWADGLIISTPTGSTGYSLSCGGPLIMPQSKNFIISPISPHNLNVRPIVVPETSEISFQIEGRTKSVMVSLDSRSKNIPASLSLKVKKEFFSVKLVVLNSYNYLQTLRSKLNWGLDMRN